MTKLFSSSLLWWFILMSLLLASLTALYNVNDGDVAGMAVSASLVSIALNF